MKEGKANNDGVVQQYQRLLCAGWVVQKGGKRDAENAQLRRSSVKKSVLHLRINVSAKKKKKKEKKIDTHV